ncbi:hypothetical protein PILCRDRAFT_113762 [Piloderma croceum F 1598]|uniref:Nephrocystin 3-like N-terminal domain-containing protein n=1 Tax=Piloderma croceum (strain F 1598) TaxID=765440 RepID=A0A0C3GKR0_PILCF|nr:hypothetical protein PILCRDRAFT_113762 [Piloderma croceum F 1598]
MLVAVISSERDSVMIQGINKNITRLLELFWLENHIAGTILLRDVLSAAEKQDIWTHDLLRQGATLREDIIGTVNKHTLNQRIQSLPHANAAYNSYVSGNNKRQACFQGTRETILSKIAGWIGSEDGQRLPIYVLHGIAGIGKSTVAQTIAQRAAELGYLGASFFFSRNEDNRKNGKLFFSTIALQLSQYDSEFASSIGAALERMPDAATRGLPDQLKTLIIDPLRDLCRLGSRSVLIVIDAMDECDVQDAKDILSLLARELPRLVSFKAFITTRPERHIRDILSGRNHERFYLHEIEHSVVEADIRLYLQHRLSREMVQNELPELKPPPWEPSLKDLDALVRVAGKLFIIASTAVRFILDTTELNPCSQMARLLDGFDEEEYTNQRPEQALDDIYLQILRSSVPKGSRNYIVKRFHMVVGL